MAVSKILQESHVTKKLHRLPRLPNCGKLSWVKCCRNAKRKLWQTGKTVTVWGVYQFWKLPQFPKKTPQTAAVSAKRLQKLPQFQKTAPVSETVPVRGVSVGNCPSLGSFRSQDRESEQQPELKILLFPRGNSTNCHSLGVLALLSPQTGAVSETGAVSRNWGSLGSLGNFNTKSKNVTKPLV